MSSSDSIYVVLKVTEVCNLSCKYCYFFVGGDDSYTRNPARLEPEMIEKIGAFLARGVEELGLSTVDISLHGGEPLMLGKRRFEQLCRVLHRHISPKARLKLDIQTNATLLDDEWVKILSAYEVGIGVSLDGPKHVNDRERVNKKGAGSYDDVVKGLNVLKRGEDAGLIHGFGVICVVDPNADAAELYDHFAHTLNLNNLFFRPPIMDWTGYDSKVAEKVAAFYSTLLNAWMRDNNPRIRINFLSSILAAMVSDVGATSYAHALQNMLRSFSIRSNGDLCPDDSLLPKDSRFAHTGFNVGNCTLKEFSKAAFWDGIDRPSLGLDSDCQRCKWRGLCRGGPAEERYVGNLEFSSKTVYCDARKSLFNGMYDAVGAITGFDALDQRIAKTLAID